MTLDQTLIASDATEADDLTPPEEGVACRVLLEIGTIGESQPSSLPDQQSLFFEGDPFKAIVAAAATMFTLEDEDAWLQRYAVCGSATAAVQQRSYRAERAPGLAQRLFVAELSAIARVHVPQESTPYECLVKMKVETTRSTGIVGTTQSSLRTPHMFSTAMRAVAVMLTTGEGKPMYSVCERDGYARVTLTQQSYHVEFDAKPSARLIVKLVANMKAFNDPVDDRLSKGQFASILRGALEAIERL